jgi:hypothetical protein
MPDTSFELPLKFDGHVARIIVTRLHNGSWHVCTEVDGRRLGWEQFTHRIQVERFRSRMQQWIAQAEAAERRLARVA